MTWTTKAQRWCRSCELYHPYEQDGCDSWPPLVGREQQTVTFLGTGRKERDNGDRPR
jgi:hypothetical protein